MASVALQGYPVDTRALRVAVCVSCFAHEHSALPNQKKLKKVLGKNKRVNLFNSKSSEKISFVRTSSVSCFAHAHFALHAQENLIKVFVIRLKIVRDV